MRALTPGTEAQRWIQARALAISGEIAQTRWLMLERSGSPVPTPFILLLASWLTILFVTFGLFAPQNGTVIAAQMVCALSIAGAVFFILDMALPFRGFVRISSDPLQEALHLLGQ